MHANNVINPKQSLYLYLHKYSYAYATESGENIKNIS